MEDNKNHNENDEKKQRQRPPALAFLKEDNDDNNNNNSNNNNVVPIDSPSIFSPEFTFPSNTLGNGASPSPGSRARRGSGRGNGGLLKEKTTVVFSSLPSVDLFVELLRDIEASVGQVKSHYFREAEMSGFTYFHEESAATQVREKYNDLTFQGHSLTALTPSQFHQQDDQQGNNNKNRPSRQSNPGMPRTLSAQTSFKSISGLGGVDGVQPSTTVVLKNLNFCLKNEALLDFLVRHNVQPISVNYHYDNNGLFRGIAFAKFKTVEAATEAIEKVNTQELCGRSIRAAFQRSGAGSSSVLSTPQPLMNAPTMPAKQQSTVGLKAPPSMSPLRRAASLPGGVKPLLPTPADASTGTKALLVTPSTTAVTTNVMKLTKPPVLPSSTASESVAKPSRAFAPPATTSSIVYETAGDKVMLQPIIRHGLEFEIVPQHCSFRESNSQNKPPAFGKVNTGMPLLRDGLEFAS